VKNRLTRLIATGFYTGYCPLWPGTAGSIPAWLIVFFLVKGNNLTLGILTAVTFAVSVWTAQKMEPVLGHDARKIVIDEWTGMFVSVLFLPYSLVNYVIAFAAFRFFDVVKLPPARQSERLSGGWGVTMDDVVAGIQANLAAHVLIFVLEKYLGQGNM